MSIEAIEKYKKKISDIQKKIIQRKTNISNLKVQIAKKVSRLKKLGLNSQEDIVDKINELESKKKKLVSKIEKAIEDAEHMFIEE